MIRKYVLALTLTVLFAVQVNAHDADKAFFGVTENAATTEIIAEFPFAIRDALIAAYPTLKDAKDKADFEKALFNYLNEHLKLFSDKETPFKLKEVIQDNSLSGHQSIFRITYEGKNLHKIRNTVMFNLGNHQENLHVIKTLNNERKEFNATESQPDYVIESEKDKAIPPFIWIIVAILLIIVQVVLFIKKRKKSERI